MIRWTLAAIFLIGCSISSQAKNPSTDPFTTLRQAYLERDAELAASAYGDLAELTYDFGEMIEIYKGREEIKTSFADFFSRLDPNLELDLNFRVESSTQLPETLKQTGIYRLRFGELETSYGTFSVVIGRNEGKFLSDFSTLSTMEEYETLQGKDMLNLEK